MQTLNEALAEFKEDKGHLNTELPDVMKYLDGLFQVSLAGGALTTKEMEFIVLTTHCEPCILVHPEKALAAGATRAEILEACDVAIAMGGGPTILKYLAERA